MSKLAPKSCPPPRFTSSPKRLDQGLNGLKAAPPRIRRTTGPRATHAAPTRLDATRRVFDNEAHDFKGLLRTHPKPEASKRPLCQDDGRRAEGTALQLHVALAETAPQCDTRALGSQGAKFNQLARRHAGDTAWGGRATSMWKYGHVQHLQSIHRMVSACRSHSTHLHHHVASNSLRPQGKNGPQVLALPTTYCFLFLFLDL